MEDEWRHEWNRRRNEARRLSERTKGKREGNEMIRRRKRKRRITQVDQNKHEEEYIRRTLLAMPVGRNPGIEKRQNNILLIQQLA